MRDAVALQRYLSRHIETGLPPAPAIREPWRHTLVIPAYREDPSLLDRLRTLTGDDGNVLVILVLNRPDSDADPGANNALRRAVGLRHGQPRTAVPATTALAPGIDLHVHDLDALRGPLPAAQGVGLARKAGCDIALAWGAVGTIDSRWIHCTDADACLPADYFQRLPENDNAVAAVFPFRHEPGGNTRIDAATALYELRLHHYVLGLEYAGSPYAFHTLGSCLAVRPGAYAHVRGFPRRSGAEDFYLLNKLAKLGPIARPGGECIRLASRHSLRVPFGTGPAVQALVEKDGAQDSAVFYHPECFVALRAVLGAVPAVAAEPDQCLRGLLAAQGLPDELSAQTRDALGQLNVKPALAHCRTHCRTADQFARHFHQWFDGFRTLRLLHILRAQGWPQLTLQQLRLHTPQVWPRCPQPAWRAGSLAGAARRHWGWRSADLGANGAP